MTHPGPERFLLDPRATDRSGEISQLLSRGSVVRVELPGRVEAWAITRQTVARDLLTDHRLVKDVNQWGAWQRGEVPDGWSLSAAINPTRNVVTVDGADHRRLRSLTAGAFTRERVEKLRVQVEEITHELLDHLSGSVTQEVDLKTEFAFPLPMSVIGKLFGIAPEQSRLLRSLYESLFSSISEPEEVMSTLGALRAFYTDVLAEKRRSPGDDLTSALIQARDGSDRLTDEELLGTLSVMVAAGHETTVNLLVNAIRALCTHRDQLDLVRSGAVGWHAAIEETLRWASPVSNFLFRYATEDIDVAGTIVHKGEPILISYGAIGHDPEQHGPYAQLFDVTRDTTEAKHISFGFGPHSCPGSHLARLEARIALPALFERFPSLDLAVPDAELTPYPSLVLNSLQALPVRLSAHSNS